MIPAAIDVEQILSDLNAKGWKDYKIELVCGFSVGFLAQVRRRDMPRMLYGNAARLYNFWSDEMTPREYVSAHSSKLTT